MSDGLAAGENRPLKDIVLTCDCKKHVQSYPIDLNIVGQIAAADYNYPMKSEIIG